MMANSYAKLTTDEYAQLTTDGYAQLPLDSGDTPTTSCAWTTATVAALQQSITSLASQITSLASQVSALQTAVGALPTSVPTTAQIASAVWSNTSRTITGEVTIGNWTEIGINMITSVLPGAGDFENLVKSGEHITIEDLIAHGDSSWATASGFAKPSDLPTNYAKTSDLPTDYAKTGDAMTLTAAYDAAKTAAPTAQEVWQYETRTLTSGTSGGATAQEVWEYGTRSLTGAVTLTSDYDAAKTAAKAGDAMTLTTAYDAAKSAAKAGDAMTLTTAYDAAKSAAQEGDAMTLTSAYDAAKTAAQEGDVMTLTSAYDAAKTAAKSTDVMALLGKIYDLLGDWSVSNLTLTTDHGTYTMTRDTSGNITGVTPDD